MCRVWLGDPLSLSSQLVIIRAQSEHTIAHLRQKTGRIHQVRILFIYFFLVAASCLGNLRSSPQKSHQHFRDAGFFPICLFSLFSHKLQDWFHLMLLPRCRQQCRLYTIHATHLTYLYYFFLFSLCACVFFLLLLFLHFDIWGGGVICPRPGQKRHTLSSQ